MEKFEDFVNWTIQNSVGDYSGINATTMLAIRNFFYEDPGTNTQPYIYTKIGYDSVKILAWAWEKAVEDHNTSAAALLDGTLSPFLGLSAYLDQAASHPMVTNLNFTLEGEAELSSLSLWQLDGSSFYISSMAEVGVIYAPQVANGTPVFVPNATAYMCVTTQAIIASIMIVYERITSPLVAVMGLGLAICLVHNYTQVHIRKGLPCILRPWPILLGLSLIFSSMTIKSLLVHVLYNMTNNLVSRMIHRLPGYWIILPVGVVAFIISVLLMILTVLYPFQSEIQLRQFSSGRLELSCWMNPNSTPLLLTATTIVVMAALCTLCIEYANQNIPNRFSGSHNTVASIGIIAMLGVIVLSQNQSTDSTVWRSATVTLFMAPVFALRYTLDSDKDRAVYLLLNTLVSAKGLKIGGSHSECGLCMEFEARSVLLDMPSKRKVKELAIM
eukprot:jgi/Hompol1/1830/HPOL_005740-RA